MAMLTNDQVSQLKADLESQNFTQVQLANKYHRSRSTISDVATGRLYKNIVASTVEYDPTDVRVKKLDTEVVHLRQELNHAKRVAKANLIEGGLFQAILDETKKVISPIPPLKPVKIKRGKGSIDEDLVIHLSDGHHDSVVDPVTNDGIEEYNFNVSCARAEKYVETIIKWSQDSMSGFRFKNLWVFAYGDHTSGEIHGQKERSHFGNEFRNCIAISQLHALMYRDLAPYFEQVNCIYISGNHGRTTPKKDHYGAWENYDYLIAEQCKAWTADIPNINYLIPNAFSVNVNINGHGFNLSHGDDVRGSLGIPFYGMVKRAKNLLALNSRFETPVKYFCMGHHHVAATLQEMDGEMIVNGAWLGTDPYAFNTFAGYREPVQWMHGVHKKYGVTSRLPIKMRFSGDTRGPKRYKIHMEQ